MQVWYIHVLLGVVSSSLCEDVPFVRFFSVLLFLDERVGNGLVHFDHQIFVLFVSVSNPFSDVC